MKYAVEVTNMATGETVTTPQEGVTWDDGSEFWWSEGNMACDCNRRWEFLRGKGVAEKDLPGMDDDSKDNNPCGSGAFRVHVVGDDGKVLYSERTP